MTHPDPAPDVHEDELYEVPGSDYPNRFERALAVLAFVAFIAAALWVIFS